MDYREGEDGEVVVRYQNTYEDIPLEECYMDVKFEDGIVAGIERQWIEPVEEGSAKLFDYRADNGPSRFYRYHK